MPNSRRKFLSQLCKGGSVSAATRMPKYWVKPMVAAVVLPAHATTSETPPVTPPVVPPDPPVPMGSQTFTASGSFIVPENVTSILVSATAGAGGGGGGGNAGMFDIGGTGGSGSLGENIEQRFTVSAGATLAIVIGMGGAGGLPYLATRRANGGDAGLAGTPSSVTGAGVNLVVAGGRGGGGGGGAVGGTTTPWQAGDGINGNMGGAGGIGVNRTTPDPSRDGASSLPAFEGTGDAGNGGAGAMGSTASFTRGSAGSQGIAGNVIISWG